MTDNLFPRVGRWQRGYHRKQVETFLDLAKASYEGKASSSTDIVTAEDVRAVTFDMVVDGYHTGYVDAALDRLEEALLKRTRSNFIAKATEEEWLEEAADRATTLYPRLQRPAGERFRDASGQGYSKEAVDGLCDRIADYFENGTPISARQVRLATFPLARSARAYDEAVVDSFLDRAVEVLMAVE